MQAQFNLSTVYYNGEGVPKNLDEAIKWCRKAAEQGHVQAQYNLGRSFYNGQGVRKNFADAAKWYLKAAQQGHAGITVHAMYAYENGEGVPKNLTEAVKWIAKLPTKVLLERRSISRCCIIMVKEFLRILMRLLSGIPKLLSKVMRKHRLTWGCYNGEGVPKEAEAEAAKWTQAAEQGSSDVQSISPCYITKAREFLKDEIEALAWFNLASAAGDQEAVKNREILEKYLGREARLLSQKRSKEILKVIEQRNREKN